MPGVAAAVLGVIMAQPAAASLVPFDFEDQVFGADTPFSITEGSLTASFSSSGDVGGFGITAAYGLFPIMSGNILVSPGSAFVDSVPLTIMFSQPVIGVSFLFGLGSADPAGTIDLTTDGGDAASATGTISVGSLLPQGELVFSGHYFTTLTLSSTALDFGIDNLVIDLPEPAPMAALTLGMLMLSVVRRHRL
jgi:hypothetical protein